MYADHTTYAVVYIAGFIGGKACGNRLHVHNNYVTDIYSHVFTYTVAPLGVGSCGVIATCAGDASYIFGTALVVTSVGTVDDVLFLCGEDT